MGPDPFLQEHLDDFTIGEGSPSYAHQGGTPRELQAKQEPGQPCEKDREGSTRNPPSHKTLVEGPPYFYSPQIEKCPLQRTVMDWDLVVPFKARNTPLVATPKNKVEMVSSLIPPEGDYCLAEIPPTPQYRVLKQARA